ncbi:MAG: porin family protein [Bacteroidia bacterium]
MCLNKLTITMLFVFSFFATILNGQTNKFNIGIEGGPSLIFLRGDEVVEIYDKITLGYSGGLTFQYNLQDNFSVKTHLAYERKGSKSTFQETDVSGIPISEFTTYINYDYLTVPLLGHFHVGDKVRLFANFGPYFGFLFNQTNITEPHNGIPKFKSSGIDDLKRLDWGLIGGLGGGFTINELLLTLEVRHNLGLYNIRKEDLTQHKILTNSTNLLVGLAFLIGED